MSDIMMDDAIVEMASADKQALDTRILTGIACALAAFTLGLALVLLITIDDPMAPVEALVDWLAG